MLNYAVNVHEGPVAIRYPRGNTEAEFERSEFVLGKAQNVSSGKDLAILCTGRMIVRAQEIANFLKSDGITCEIVAFPTIKPIDQASVIAAAMKCKRIITLEDGVRNGGLGYEAASILAEKEIHCKFKIFAFPDEPIVHGSVDELDKKYGMDTSAIALEVYKWLR